MNRLRSIPRLRTLGSLIYEGAFGVLPPGDSYLNAGGVRFLRATELGPENRINWNACLRVPGEYLKHTRAVLKRGDVLIAVKGATIASEKSVCIVATLEEPTLINGSIFRFQPKEEVTSEFLLEILTSELVKRQMKLSLILNNAVDYLGRSVLDKLAFPLPEREVQEKMVAEMKTARSSRLQKLARAQSIVADLDSYLITQLGVLTSSPERRWIFAVTSSRLRGQRWDAKAYMLQHSPFRGSYRNKRISEFTQRIQQHFPPDEISADDFITLSLDGTIKPKRIMQWREFSNPGSLFKAQMFRATKGDIIFSKIDFRNGAVAIVDRSRVAVTAEFPVYRLDKSAVDPEYVVLCLRLPVFRNWAGNLSSGHTGRRRVAPSQFERFEIPYPPLPLQQAIVAEIKRRKGEARRLRKEAADEWAAAKARFERQLLEGR